jgi:hypothetical protein
LAGGKSLQADAVWCVGAFTGIDKYLTPAELDAICQHYVVPKTASMEVMQYTQFLADVDSMFTKPVSTT